LIGSNLCEHFLNLGNKVVCLDNFSTGHHKNIEAFFANKNFSLIEGDIDLFIAICNNKYLAEFNLKKSLYLYTNGS